MSTAIHHLNCVTMSPPLSLGGRIPPRMVAHCLLLESDRGLTVVDTGFGTADLADPTKRLGSGFVKGMRPALDPAETALAQIQALGHSAADVRNIVLTHLDLDHAGGIADFPDATVHVFGDELEAARRRRSILERNRYKSAQWAHGPRWLAHEVVGEQWFGFDSVTVLDDDVLLVPMRGHTRGHCAVACRRPSGGWFLHCGDAYFSHGEKQTPPTCPSGLSFFQTTMQMDKAARHHNQDRLRSLHAEHGPDSTAAPEEVVTLFSAHDAVEYDALAAVVD